MNTNMKALIQQDVASPLPYDVSTRDSRSVMDVAVFRLSKGDRRAGEVIRYELPDGYVQVSSGRAGMASVWDYDLILMAISHLTVAMDRYKEGKGEKPGRAFRPHVGDVLKFCHRGRGGMQIDGLLEACIRLNTTHVAIQRTKTTANGRLMTVCKGEALISRYEIIKNENGWPEFIEIELADWIYREITEGENPDVLTVHPDYFLIDQGIGRFLYRLARRAAGKTEANWLFKTIYERSGSSGSFKKFCFLLRRLIEANNLPEYELKEEEGQAGPILVMRYRHMIEAEAVEKQDESKEESKYDAEAVLVTEKAATEKERTTTKTTTAYPPLPDWLPPDLWQHFREHRRRLRKPMTPEAERLNLRTLEKLRSEGQDIVAVVEQSIARGWQGLFPVRGGASKMQFINRAEALEERNRAAAEAWLRGTYPFLTRT